ncbi:helicase associated domain-containing protein [Curtobacterium sp. Leaf261]|uniref:helicase associated domain-containing protein n=1 Tax=Curtobacterium sp. Leaf261 TaxID=1736311 RepID=UPI00138F3835|nr:helicase associated domain-containing protein [Curtobacterium sp. Leaf261]
MPMISHPGWGLLLGKRGPGAGWSMWLSSLAFVVGTMVGVDVRALRWESMFAALLSFRDEYGHADIPRSFCTGAGASLGAWVHRQRSLAASGRLPTDRRERLEAVGMRWSLTERTTGVAAFAAFQDTEGHGLVPHAFTTADGFPLGTWVQSRRRQWANDPVDTVRLWPELVDLGFVWQVRNRDAAWDAGIAALTQYGRDHGELSVPHWFTTADGLQLGRWVDSRRVEYRAGVLPTARVEQLERLGMVWRLRLLADDPARRRREDVYFTQMLCRVQAWSTEHAGQVPAARIVDSDGIAIGRWLLRQRRLHRQRRLASDRLAQLDAWNSAWSSLRGEHI